MVYGGVIVKQDGTNLLIPMRSFCRPAGKPAFYNKKFPGLYNARRDNLEKFWAEQFGTHHAIMVMDSFFENVSMHTLQHRELAPGEQEQNVVFTVHTETGAKHVDRVSVFALDRSKRTGLERVCRHHG